MHHGRKLDTKFKHPGYKPEYIQRVFTKHFKFTVNVVHLFTFLQAANILLLLVMVNIDLEVARG